MQLDLNQVSLLTPRSYRDMSLSVPLADGAVDVRQLDPVSKAALDDWTGMLSVSRIAHQSERADAMFVARDGYRLIMDDAKMGYSAEPGFLVARNTPFTLVMRDAELSFYETCALRRADYSAGMIRKKKKLQPATIVAVEQWIQIVRVSPNFDGFWNLMETKHPLFFATDLDELTA